MNIMDLFKPRGAQEPGGGFNLFPDAPWKQLPGYGGPLQAQNPSAVTMPPMEKPRAFGLDKPFGDSSLNRGDMMALALSQIGQQYGPSRGQGQNMMAQAVMQKQKQRSAENERQKLVQMMKSAGYSDQDIVAVQFAPEQAIKAIYDQKAPYTLTEGQQRRDGNNQVVADAPKYTYQNDQILRQGADGVQNMGRLDPSYENIETGRHNRQMEGIGWKNANTTAQNAGAQWLPMTAEQVAAAGLAPGTAAQINTRTGEYKVAPQGNKSGQLTEQEAKFGLYAGQGLQAAADLDALEVAGYNRAGWGEMATSAFSDEAKIYDNKITQFIDAWARAMTGAAMTKEESNRYIRQLSPQPFDTQEVRDQKSEMRRQMADQLRIAAGRGMKIADQTVTQGGDQSPPPPQVPLVDLNGRIIR